jgi:isoleucyl-tRNA synthetase
VRDRIYTYAPKSLARRSAQTAFYEVVHRLARLAAPVLAFTADEIWENIPGASDEAASVHLTLFPAYEDAWVDEALLVRYEKLFDIRSVVMKALEDARNAKLIGSGQDAKVTITAPAETKEFLESFGEDLHFDLIVSQVELQKGADLNVIAGEAEGEKCERCWYYTTDVGADPRFPVVCGRCVGNLEEMLG